MGHENRPKDKPALLRDLRADWRQWTAAVELYARRAGGRCAPAAYAALYSRLLADCLRLADSSEGEEATFYHSLEELARPWLTTGALETADWEILCDLLARCREAGARLGCWTQWGALARSSGVLAAGAVAAGGVVALVQMARAGLLRPGEMWLDDTWRSAWLTSASLAESPWAVSALAATVGLLAIALATRATRP